MCRIAFAIPGNDSLKGKRRVLRRIVDRTRNQFNAAVAEVASQDEHRRAVLAFCVVSNDGRHANAMLDRIAGFVSGLTEAVIVDRALDLIPIGEFHGGVPDFERSNGEEGDVDAADGEPEESA